MTAADGVAVEPALEQIDAGELLVQSTPQKELLGLARLPLAEVEIPQSLQRGPVARLQGESALEVLVGQLRLIVVQLGAAQGRPGFGDIGSEADRLAEALERLVVAARGGELPSLLDQPVGSFVSGGQIRGRTRGSLAGDHRRSVRRVSGRRIRGMLRFIDFFHTRASRNQIRNREATLNCHPERTRKDLSSLARRT